MIVADVASALTNDHVSVEPHDALARVRSKSSVGKPTELGPLPCAPEPSHPTRGAAVEGTYGEDPSPTVQTFMTEGVIL